MTSSPRSSKIYTFALSLSSVFDTREDDQHFRLHGISGYIALQKEREHMPFKPGTMLPLLLTLNHNFPDKFDFIFVSRAHPAVKKRLILSLREYGLYDNQHRNHRVDRTIFTNGRSVLPALKMYGVDHFITTRSPEAQQDAIDALRNGITADCVNAAPPQRQGKIDIPALAFDLDGVVFDRTSETVFQKQIAREMKASQEQLRPFKMDNVLQLYIRHESTRLTKPLPPGSHLRLIQFVHEINASAQNNKIDLSVITARAGKPQERAIRSLEHYGITGYSMYPTPYGVTKAHVAEHIDPIPHLFSEDTAKNVDLTDNIFATGHVLSEAAQRPIPKKKSKITTTLGAPK